MSWTDPDHQLVLYLRMEGLRKGLLCRFRIRVLLPSQYRQGSGVPSLVFSLCHQAAHSPWVFKRIINTKTTQIFALLFIGE